VDPDRLRDVAHQALAVFDEEGSPGHLASAHEALAMYHRFFTGDMDAMAEAAEAGLETSRAVGDAGAAAGNALQLGRALVMGPTPCDEALDRLKALVGSFAGDRMLEAAVGLDAATLLANLGRTEQARRVLERSGSVFEELGQRRWLAEVSSVQGEVERAAGAPEQAAVHLRRAFDAYRRRGEGLDIALAAGALGIALSDLGVHHEAEVLVREIRAASPPRSVEPTVSVARLRGRSLATRGRHDSALEALGSALGIVAATSIVGLHGQVLVDVASVHRARGSLDEARSAAEAARELFRAKRDVVAAERVESLLLRAGGPHPSDPS
jgi:tetratricopeptide (TPR) repeat protein